MLTRPPDATAGLPHTYTNLFPATCDESHAVLLRQQATLYMLLLQSMQSLMYQRQHNV